jgi:hypothetical protein
MYAGTENISPDITSTSKRKSSQWKYQYLSKETAVQGEFLILVPLAKFK